MIKPLDPSLAQSSASEQKLDEIKRKTEVEAKSLAGTPDKNKEKKLREACEGFESIFIQQMWQSMRSSIPKEGFMHSKEEEFWQGMYDQELSKSMASAGGIGLADMMMQQLSKKIQNPSDEQTSSTAKEQKLDPTQSESIPLQNNLQPLQIKAQNIQIQNPTHILPINNSINISSPIENPLQEVSEQTPINNSLSKGENILSTEDHSDKKD